MGAIVHLHRRPWLQVLLCMLLGSAAAAAVTLLTAPTYRSETDVFVTVGETDNGGSVHDRALFATDRVKSYVPLVTSPAVMAGVKQRLGRPESVGELARVVRAENATGTVLLTITADGRSSAEAQQLTAATAQELARVVGAVEAGTPGSPSPVSMRVVPPVAGDSPPVSPRPLFNLFMGTMTGLAVGAASVVISRRFDATVHDAEDLARAGAPPCLASIRRDRRGAAAAAVIEDHRMLRSRLHLVPADVPRSIAVVSPARRDGRTTTVAHLARVIRQAGWRVTVVDTDLRHPALHRNTGVGDAPGLVDAVRDHALLDDVLRPSAAGDLTVLPSGTPPEEPGDLLAPAVLEDLADELAKRADVILFDTPALLDVADAAVVASVADDVLLVARAGRTTRAELAESARILDAIGRRPLGTVLTMAERPRRRPFALPTPAKPEGLR
jgi:capsular exopolysaccharide synthesis family protein